MVDDETFFKFYTSLKEHGDKQKAIYKELDSMAAEMLPKLKHIIELDNEEVGEGFEFSELNDDQIDGLMQVDLAMELEDCGADMFPSWCELAEIIRNNG